MANVFEGECKEVKRKRGRPKKIDSSRTFVAGHKEYLDPLKRAEYEKQIKSLEFTAKNIDNEIDGTKPWLYNPKSTNVGDLRRQAAKLKKTIARRTPPQVDGKVKNELYARAKALEREITRDMPTRDEMMGKRRIGSDGKPYVVPAEQAIQKQMAWQVKQAGNVREWKQIMRLLDPLDPGITNVERLRRAK